jgi:hypothetical protein
MKRSPHVQKMLMQAKKHEGANILPLPGEIWTEVMQDETGDVLLAIERNMTTTLRRQETIYHLEMYHNTSMPLAPKYLRAWRGWMYIMFKLMRTRFYLDMTEE